MGRQRTSGRHPVHVRSACPVVFIQPSGAGTSRPEAPAFAAQQIAEALRAVEEAIARFEHSEASWLIAPLLRSKGELLLLQGEEGAAATAEDHFRQALER